MQCANCGSELKEGAKFCRECGNKVIIVEKTEALSDNQCPECGNILEEGAIFCNNCGYKLSQDEQVVEDYKVCPNCRKKLKPNAIFCGECGQSIDNIIEGIENVSNVKPKQKKDNGLTGLIIALVAVVILCVSAIAFVYFRNNSVDIDEPNIENKSEDEMTIDNNEVIDDEDSDANDAHSTNLETVSTYSVCKSDANWYEAKDMASNAGGHLICINDSDEFNMACSLAEQNGIKVFWVGAKRDLEDSWRQAFWEDGTKLEANQWFDGEPSYKSEDGADEQFLMVFCVKGQWYYNDAESDVAKYYSGKMGYIIEKEELVNAGNDKEE